jgi:hypothetical protein
VIDRRTFLAGTGAVLLAAPLAAEAQQAGTVRQIGSLGTGALPTPAELAQNSFNQELRKLGWIEGKNLLVARLRARPDDAD